MRIQFVGQAPSQETDGKPPFTGKCGKFLANLLGTTQEQMLEDHDFINVLDRWPGKGIGGDKFPLIEAQTAAKAKLELLRDKPFVILLGNNVARAFGAKAFTYLTWYEIRNPENFADVVVPRMSVVPHPSGVNRYWNSPKARDAARRFFNSITSHGKAENEEPVQADRQDVSVP